MLPTYRNYRGHGPRTTGSVIIRDAYTMKRLFVMCFYDNPIGMHSIVVYGNNQVPGPDDILSGGHLVRKALKRRGLNPDDFVCSPFEAANTSLV